MRRDPGGIDARLAAPERDWDIERTLEANAATVPLTGTVLGSTIDRRWLARPAVASGFLLQHAVQGWCPPVPVLRRLGVWTAAGIGQAPDSRAHLEMKAVDASGVRRALGLPDTGARWYKSPVRPRSSAG